MEPVGISAIQNGPCADFLDAILRNWENSEEYNMPKKGLEKTGLWQMLQEKPTLAFLFRERDVRLSIQKLITMLVPGFSDRGTSKRQHEERVYGHFIKYLRCVAAGRIPLVTLQKILAFITGAEEEPVLGFTMDPSVKFAVLPGNLPTASTCTNSLTLPISLAEENEETAFDKFSLAFTNEYFGFC